MRKAGFTLSSVSPSAGDAIAKKEKIRGAFPVKTIITSQYGHKTL